MTAPSPKPLDSLKSSKLRRLLASKCAEVRDLQVQISALTGAKRSLMDEISTAAKSARLGRVDGDGWMLLKKGSTRKSISGEKLLEKGVKWEVIEYATEVSESSWYEVREAK